MCTGMAIAEAGELSEFCFKLTPLLDHFRAQRSRACSLESFSMDIDFRVPTAAMVSIPRIVSARE